MPLSLDDYFLKVFDLPFLSKSSQEFFSLSNFKKIYHWDIPERPEAYSLLDLTSALQKNAKMDSPSTNLLDELIYTFFPTDHYALFIALSNTNKTLTDSDRSQLFTVKEIGSALANLCFKNLFGPFLLRESHLLFPDVWDKKKSFFQYPCPLSQILFEQDEPTNFYNDFYSFDFIYDDYQDMVIEWTGAIDTKFETFREILNNDTLTSENVLATITDFQNFVSTEKNSLLKMYLSIQTELKKIYAPSKDYFSFHKMNMDYIFSIQEKESEKFFAQLDELLLLFADTIPKEFPDRDNVLLCCQAFNAILYHHIAIFNFQLCDIFKNYKRESYAPNIGRRFSEFFSQFFQYELLENYFKDFHNSSDMDSIRSQIIQETYSFRKKKGFKTGEREYSVDEKELLTTLFQNILFNLQNKELPLSLQSENRKIISDQVEDRFDIKHAETNILQGNLTEINDSLIATYFPYLVFSYISTSPKLFIGAELAFSFKERTGTSENKNNYKSYKDQLAKAFSAKIDKKKKAYTISELEYRIFLFSCCIEVCFELVKKYALKINIDYQASSALFLWSVSAYIPDSREILEISTLKNCAPIIGHINDSFEIGSCHLFQYIINRLYRADLSSFCKMY